MITEYLKNEVLESIKEKTAKAFIILNDIEQEILIIKKEIVSKELNIYISIGSDINGLISDILLKDINNNILIHEERTLTKTDNELLLSKLVIKEREVI